MYLCHLRIDQAGMRLATLDQNTGVFGLWGVSTWTAAGQLYYSQTPESPTGPYESADSAEA